MGAYNDPDVQFGPHEEAHTLQYESYGVFFAVGYLTSGEFATLNNTFEQAAQNYGGLETSHPGAGADSWNPY